MIIGLSIIVSVIILGVILGGVAYAANRPSHKYVMVGAANTAPTNPDSTPAPKKSSGNKLFSKAVEIAKKPITWIIVGIVVVLAFLLKDGFVAEQWWLATQDIRQFIEDYWVALVFVLIAILIFAGMKLKKPFNLISWFVLLIIFAIFLSPFLNWVKETVDRGINHGEWHLPMIQVNPVPGRTLYHPFVFTLTADWQEVRIPPGTCVTADPIDIVDYVLVRRDLTKVRSATGQEEVIYLTWKKSGTCS